MPFLQLQCPACNAPLEASASRAVITCRYCGAVLRDASAPTKTQTVYAVTMERVGPSNRARIIAVLRTYAEIAEADVEQIVDRAPCELVVWEYEERAEMLRQALNEAGGVARVEPREIALPEPVVLPDRGVCLDSVGADKVAVMKVVREHVDLGMTEAKRLVERAPCVLVETLEGSRAAAFLEALIKAGATARRQ